MATDTGVLHKAPAPQQSLEQFVLMYSAMKPHAFQAKSLNAQGQLKISSAVLLNGKKPPPSPSGYGLRRWAQIWAETMCAHKGDFTSVALQLPSEFQDVLVVSCQPKQVWAIPGKGSPTNGF